MNSAISFIIAGLFTTMTIMSCTSSRTARHFPAGTPSGQYKSTGSSQPVLFQNKYRSASLSNDQLTEVSGIAASAVDPGVLYMHEDSGNGSYIYLSNTEGKQLGKIIVSLNDNRDCEDIAVGPVPDAGLSYIYLADIGDNNKWRKRIRIYRFPEPAELSNGLNKENATPFTKRMRRFTTLDFSYPDGAHDAEAILIDPVTGNLFIATKEDDSCRLFVLTPEDQQKRKATLKPAATLPLRLVTGGDIAPDGKEILLRSEEYIWYWTRKNNESIAAALCRPPKIILNSDEQQGEAVCFAADKSGYFTISETRGKQKPLLRFYERKGRNESVAEKKEVRREAGDQGVAF